MNLLLSTVALLLGPLVYALGERNPLAKRLFDGIVVLAIAWIIGVHIIPNAVTAGGLPALVFLALGILFPIVLRKLFHNATRATHFAVMFIAGLGLCIHALIDGIALLPASGNGLAHAIILHRLPVGMAIWWTFRPALGNTAAVFAFAIIIVATAAAYYLGAPVVEMAASRRLAFFQAFVSGTLIDLVVLGLLAKLRLLFR